MGVSMDSSAEHTGNPDSTGAEVWLGQAYGHLSACPMPPASTSGLPGGGAHTHLSIVFLSFSPHVATFPILGLAVVGALWLQDLSLCPPSPI